MKPKTRQITGKVNLIGSYIHRQPNVHDEYFDVLNPETQQSARVYYDKNERPRIYNKSL